MKKHRYIPKENAAASDEYDRYFEYRDDYPKCLHQNTILINEEGHSGKYCVDCGMKLEEE